MDNLDANKMYCPLATHPSDSGLCVTSKCAWWIAESGNHGSCAVVKLTFALVDLQAGIENGLQYGWGG